MMQTTFAVNGKRVVFKDLTASEARKLYIQVDLEAPFSDVVDLMTRYVQSWQLPGDPHAAKTYAKVLSLATLGRLIVAWGQYLGEAGKLLDTQHQPRRWWRR